MYYLKKVLTVDGSHYLDLPYDSKCTNCHGHSWKITVQCKSEDVNQEGMLIDFTRIKRIVMEQLDHRNFNDVLDFNPTAENIAKWLCEQIPYCYKVTVQETEGNEVTYEA